ncbi:hypothetical protein TNCT_146901 [Trichonephila clavata]|uniref:Uncharacterized protein n=1 Tax=Trichonephila clavata TaxID=2740835 RepID=A0A8X6G462_TRICU|nr:hypothetical protein TNCT_146901 [Trichonephila clavata]
MEESESDKVTLKRQYSTDGENDVNNTSEVSKKQKVDSSSQDSSNSEEDEVNLSSVSKKQKVDSSSQDSSNSEEDEVNLSSEDDCKSFYNDISKAYDGVCDYCGNKILKSNVDADLQFPGSCWWLFAHYAHHCHQRELDFRSDNSES